ncbi:MAG: ATP-binding protein, partial [Rhodospirillaceae bacterium]
MKGFSTWGALIVVLGFGVILGSAGGGGVSTWAMAAGAGLGLAGALLMLREASVWQVLLSRTEALDAFLARDKRAVRIVDANGRTIVANAEGRRFWGVADPLAALEARLSDTEAEREALDRLRGAYQAGLDDAQELSPRPARDERLGGRDWLRIEVRALPRPAGARLLIASDISARRAVENVLKAERETLSDFLDFLPVGVYALDAAQNFRYVNLALAEWLGATPDALLGAPFAAILAEGSARPEVDGAWRGLVRLRGARGVGVPALLVQSLYDENGETLTRAVVVRDAADAAAEPGGNAAGPFGRLVFDEAPVGIAVVDVAGLPYPMLAEANETLAGMLGRARDDLIGLALGEIVEPAMRDEVAAVFARAAAGLSVAPMEVRLDSPRDLTAMIHMRTLPGDAAEGAEVPARLLVHVVDTTDRRVLQMQTAQAQKMQAMGQLAGGVAHDFNNLLTAMIGFCDLLLQRHGPGSASFTDIMQIKQNANRAANLVRQLLAFSRRQPLLPRFVRVPDALAELSHLLRRLLGETIEFELVHGRDVGYVRVDPGQFDQVILNLAVNARDAMVGGGRLSIRTEAGHLTEPLKVGTETVAPGHYAVIRVSDTGTGIAKEDLGRIFEPFFSTKAGSAAAGTGLGLSTVYGIVRQTEGTVTVESKKGEGATFTIYLPRFDEAAVRARAAAATPPEEAAPDRAIALPQGKAVLIVEDEDAVRVFGARALSAKGYTVLEAADGEQAIGILQDHDEVDVLITDMVMPGMDGATLARLVRQEYPAIRVVLMSGYSEDIASD